MAKIERNERNKKVKRDLKYDTAGRAKTVKYATKERKARINPKNITDYQSYIKTSVMRNRDVKDTTYKVYQSYFNIFLCYIEEYWDNFYILDEEFIEENMIDVMEGFMGFLQGELNNGKKAINTKLSAVSSFYIWAVKRRKIRSHPFENRLERMANAGEEKIISEYFLTEAQVADIVLELSNAGQEGIDYDKMDQLIWHIAYDSACRIGALSKLTVSSYIEDEKGYRFDNIREKRSKMVSIPISPATREIYLEFLKLREELGVDCDELFYVKTVDGYQGMSKQSISTRIKKMGYIIGIGDFRPHCIRKTRLNQVAKYDINKAKLLGNHESLDTTSRFYTEKEDQADVLNSIMELEAKGIKKKRD